MNPEQGRELMWEEEEDGEQPADSHERPPFLVWSCARIAVDPFEAVMASIVVLVATWVYQVYLCPSPGAQVSVGSAEFRPVPFTLECPNGPKCGRPMVLRQTRGANPVFLGCSPYRAMRGACNATRDAAMLLNARIA